MKKRNLRPQQTAPVGRETTTTNSEKGGEKGLAPFLMDYTNYMRPFAGDDAE